MREYSQRLRHWVDEQWPTLNRNDFGLNPEFHRPGDRAPEWQALTGDAGFRRYFRLTSTPALLAVYAPPESEDMTAFIDIAHHLRASGVLVPAIAAFDKAQGFMLIEDLGSSLLYNELSFDSVDTLYADALTSLLQIQLTSVDEQVFPPYSSVKLLDEMHLFREWFVTKLLGYKLSDSESLMLKEWFALLVQSALEQPQVVVHRDYHSRNLIFRENDQPGVIDFQDAVVGPITYDLVSLLRDCYIQWPESRVKAWALSYFRLSVEAGLMKPVDDTIFLQWFDWMGLQRHIKVLGVFARLSLRDNKHGYLSDLPLVIEYILQVSKNYPQARPFLSWFEQALMPLIQKQPWHTLSGAREQ